MRKQADAKEYNKVSLDFSKIFSKDIKGIARPL